MGRTVRLTSRAHHRSFYMATKWLVTVDQPLWTVSELFTARDVTCSTLRDYLPACHHYTDIVWTLNPSRAHHRSFYMATKWLVTVDQPDWTKTQRLSARAAACSTLRDYLPAWRHYQDRAEPWSVVLVLNVSAILSCSPD